MTNIKELLVSMDYGPAPEANDHVKAWLANHGKGMGHCIGGAFVPSSGGASFEVHNPASDTLLVRVAEGTAADIDNAVAAARKAFESWSKLSGHGVSGTGLPPYS